MLLFLIKILPSILLHFKQLLWKKGPTFSLMLFSKFIFVFFSSLNHNFISYFASFSTSILKNSFAYSLHLEIKCRNILIIISSFSTRNLTAHSLSLSFYYLVDQGAAVCLQEKLDLFNLQRVLSVPFDWVTMQHTCWLLTKRGFALPSLRKTDFSSFLPIHAL